MVKVVVKDGGESKFGENTLSAEQGILIIIDHVHGSSHAKYTTDSFGITLNIIIIITLYSIILYIII